ncbi:MAG: hypothetical protein ABIQ16_22915 [Polyangiaceae bacterium]
MTQELPIPQEQDVVPGRRLILLILGALGISAAGVAVSWALLAHEQSQPHRSGVSATALAESMHLEHTSFEQDERGIRLDADQRKQLAHYGWVDRKSGIARIPIERAMDLIVERNR